MNRVVIGIASQDAISARAFAIARGEHKPAPDEPKVWFTSMRSLAEIDRYGLVELRRQALHVRPVVKVSEFLIRAA